MPRLRNDRRRQRATTILELLAAVVVILLGLGAVFGMNAQSLQILRRAQQTTVATEILQERIETLRATPWPQISRGATLRTIMDLRTESSVDLTDGDPTEIVTVTAASSPGTPAVGADRLQIQRQHGTAKLLSDADLSSQTLLLVELKVQWRDQQTQRERQLRAIIGRDGLTRSGIFGSGFGRVGTSDGESGQTQ